MFNNLISGDVINLPGMRSQLLVLKTRGEGDKLKHLGQICGCGKHVHGFPYLYQWNDTLQLPSNANDAVIGFWNEAQVEKGAAIVLAEKFATLALNDDQPSNLDLDKLLSDNPDFLKAIEVASYSGANLGVTVVAMLRALGGTVSDEQAKLVAGAVGTYANVSVSKHLSSASEFLASLSGIHR